MTEKVKKIDEIQVRDQPKRTVFDYFHHKLGNVTDFTKLMHSQKDTNDDLDYSLTLRIALAQKRKKNLELIAQMKQHEGWLILEEMLYDRCRSADNEWAESVIEGNTKELLALATVRTGIIQIIGTIDAVEPSIETERSLIAELNIKKEEQKEADPLSKSGEADPPPSEELR